MAKSLKYRRALIEANALLDAPDTRTAELARHLRIALSEAGIADVDALVGTNRAVSTNNPVMSEIALFDAPRAATVGSAIRRSWYNAVGATFGAVPRTIEIRGAVVGRQRVFEGFRHVQAVTDLVHLSVAHFQRHGACLPIRQNPPVDVFLSPRAVPMRAQGSLNIYTITDLRPLKVPTDDIEGHQFGLLVKCLAQTADHIVTFSEATRAEIIAYTGIAPDRITVLPSFASAQHGIASLPTEEVARSLHDAYGLAYSEYYLVLDTIDATTNLPRLIQAYTAAEIDRPLVIAGPLGARHQRELERIDQPRFTSLVAEGGGYAMRRSVQWIGDPDARQRIDILRGARALVHLPTSEVFSHAVPEALSLAVPVLASRTGSAAALCGDAAVVAEPSSIVEIARALRQLDAGLCPPDATSAAARKIDGRYGPEAFAARLKDLMTRLSMPATLALPAGRRMGN